MTSKFSRWNTPSLMAIGRLIATALSFVSVPLIARFLGPVGRGETATAIAVFGLAPVLLSYGLHLGVRRIAAVGDEESVVRSARVLCLILFIPATLLALILHFTLFSSFTPDVLLTADIVVLISPLAISWMVDVSIFVVRSDYFGVMLVFLTQPLVMVVGVVTVWSVGLISSATVLAVYGCSTILTALLSWHRLRISLRGPRLGLRIVVRESREYAGSTAAEAGLRRLDQVLMLPLLGAASVGLYSVAASVVTAPLSLSQALAASYFGSIANTARRGQRALIGEAVRSSWILGIVSSLAVVALAPLFVEFVFGSEFSEASILVLWLAPVVALGVVASVQAGILNAMGRGRVMFLGHSIALAIIVGGFALALPVWGMAGAIVVVIVANLILVIITASGLGVGLTRMIPGFGDIKRTVRIFFGKS
ncbi:lipopolysaccharide biosynthesis protein [Arthrobacter sp. CJ23]|uniref:lipopolysaccharide biosynthesis protein n=1 Tax=Arthrobacter sp. CJ23 TaxID=2972479 RepID=UPI00215BC835|nr:oligosaccharide flippase family protein [Arthrobacter sp. CJ23]UVJ38736.1 oligosaccharide flippase family protein [Arthrobacter sp. CJ23]